MTVTAPPRPPRPSDLSDRDEFEALVEALIEEARQRARRRRWIYGGVATLVTVAGVAIFAVTDRATSSDTAVSAPAVLPAVSASAPGSQIAFVSWTVLSSGNARYELGVVNPDGSGQRTLLTGIVSEGSSPAWSPDGRWLAFAPWGRQHAGIYAVRAAGSRLRRLTRGNDGGPSWSPDGRAIAFTRTEPWRSAVYRMNADGSGQRRLALGAEPVWSRDGQKIAFISDRDGQADIFVMNADGSGQRNLTHSGGWDTHPVWSPDGRKIAFVRQQGRARSPHLPPPGEIYVMNADGTGLRRLTRNTAYDEEPTWSPDGRTIAFTRSTSGATSFRSAVYLMNADGSGQRKLADQSRQPVWSPDGQKIAFQSDSDGYPDIYVVDAAGGTPRRLTDHSLTRYHLTLAWSPVRTK